MAKSNSILPYLLIGGALYFLILRPGTFGALGLGVNINSPTPPPGVTPPAGYTWVQGRGWVRQTTGEQLVTTGVNALGSWFTSLFQGGGAATLGPGQPINYWFRPSTYDLVYIPGAGTTTPPTADFRPASEWEIGTFEVQPLTVI